MTAIRDTQPSRTPPVVIVLFEDRNAAERGIGALRDAGFTENQIGVAMRDPNEQRDLSESTGTPVAEGAAKGAVTGGLIGGLVGLLGSLLIPGVGPIVAGGVLASTLAGAGIGAATGGLVGALMGMGATEEEARHFDQGFRSGGILVTVDAPERADEARRILRDSGADLGPIYGRSIPDRAAAAAAAGPEAGVPEDQRILLREERLDVGTTPVQAGEVRVRKEVVLEERTIDVPVTREEVVIERRAASGEPVADAGLAEREEIRMPVSEEQVRVDKQAVPTEEIRVGKRQVSDTERVSETVAHEEARVESVGETHMRTTGDVAGTGAGTGAGARPGEGWRGRERRVRRDRNYAGPERRQAVL